MNQYTWLPTFLLGLPGATTDFKPEWGWQRYQIGGKLFAATMCPDEKYDAAYANKQLINLKCEPLHSELLRSQHPEIMPGFYTDKRNWIAIDLNGALPDDLLKSLCADSYKLVFSKLTKKLQREIGGGIP